MTTSIGVGSSAILVLEDSREGTRRGWKGRMDGKRSEGLLLRVLATFRLRRRPSDEDEDDDERTANGRGGPGSRKEKVEEPEEDEEEEEGGSGGEREATT